MNNSDIISIGFYKGEVDFSVSGKILDLNFEEMNKLRAMIVVAIGTAEDMWRRNYELKNPLANTISHE